MRNLEAAFSVDRHVRTAYELNQPEGAGYAAADIDEGLVYDHEGVRVDALCVAHWPHEDAPHALSDRVSYSGRSAVFSGDTLYAPHVARFARGADLLVHEVMVTALSDAEETAIRGASDPSRRFDVIMSLHTSPREAGRLFADAAPRLTVYSHIIAAAGTGATTQEVDATLIAQTRETLRRPASRRPRPHARPPRRHHRRRSRRHGIASNSNAIPRFKRTFRDHRQLAPAGQPFLEPTFANAVAATFAILYHARAHR
ncbi:MAG: MBL fold metallo-hydrolase [Dehalococcoidia bacterium]